MNFVGVIPARGGSKRIPHKNVAICGGKPLLVHTIEAAKRSGLNRIILSTDDEEIAALGRAHGAEVPGLRPQHLAMDTTPMVPVLQALLEELRAHDRDIQALVLLQPTSPLRRADHIDEAMALFKANPQCDSVLSVMVPPHPFHPLKALKPGDDGLVPFVPGAATAFGRRDLPDAYVVNGPAVVVVKPAVIERGEMYGSRIVPYVMPVEDSIDIDEPLDLFLADCLLHRRG